MNLYPGVGAYDVKYTQNKIFNVFFPSSAAFRTKPNIYEKFIDSRPIAKNISVPDFSRQISRNYIYIYIYMGI